MLIMRGDELELSAAWQDGVDGARWASAAAITPSGGARDSGASLLEVPPGCRLPRHTDSAEETIVVLAGRARVRVGEEEGDVPAGGLALVPQDVPHEVHNAGDGALRFLAMYASSDVVTRYERDVQPDGARERRPLDS
jgi:quercetin dioxygenase-like cupin family protein